MAAVAVAAESAAPIAKAAAAVVQGQNIFVYSNLQTNQTIYSLTRSLWNKKALAQMPYAGKKSIPSHIRKDLWQPLCVISFPKANQGLDAYRKMREFKLLHETAWNKEDMLEKNGPQAGHVLNERKVRTRAIMDQKANAIADMAAVLRIQERQPTEKELETAKWYHQRPVVELHSSAKAPTPDRPKRGKGKRPTLGKLEWQGSVEGVKIHWQNIMDAEYAETWPQDVVHGNLEINRYTAVWPPPESAEANVVASASNVLNEQATASTQGAEAVEGESKKWWQFGKK